MSGEDRGEDRTVHLDGLAPPAAAGAELYLVVASGSRSGALVRIGETPVVIGRAADAGLQIPDAGISSRHCSVRRIGPLVVAEDLGSTNGVFVDDARVAGLAPLAVGASLRLGRVHLRLELRDPEEVERQTWLDAELRKASEYVLALLPEPLRDAALTVDWRFLPSAHLGGDAFGYRRLPDGRWAICLIDVCGHGPGAALHSIAALNEFRRGTLPATDYGSPAAVLAALNDAFPMEAHGGMYFTAWYGVYDAGRRRLLHANAGHPAPLLLRRHPGSGEETLERLAGRGPAIGMIPGIRPKESETEIVPGDRLYVFSDGVFEVRLRDGRTGTREEFEELLRASADRGPEEPARIEKALRLLMAEDAFEDDFSLLAAEFL